MQAVILAAGRGTRMQQLTRDIPKPMLPIGGRPLLAHKIEMLPSFIDHVIIVIGHLGHLVIDHFGSSYDSRSITYVYQHALDGTGKAIHCAEDVLGDTFLVLMGDDLYSTDDLISLARHEHALLAYEHPDARQFGLVAIDEHFNLMNVFEKPKRLRRGLINTGAYALSRRFFDYDPVKISEDEYGLPQTLAAMAKDIPVKVIRASMWHPMTSPADAFHAEKELPAFLQ
jgi:bifunctional UDP-N-acetylglucosamine pyrophosphorylase/glucosamine-1-phosphate N-acetyltransferase